MRRVILQSPGRISVEDQDPTGPGPGEVLIRVRCATTCGTDLKAYLRGHPQIPMPGPFGHEYSGEIASVGGDVNGFLPGDPIMGVHSAPCGVCFWCRRGQENLCIDIMKSKVLGSFAEYLLLPANIVLRNLYKKPPTISFQRAALLEPLACVADAIRRMRLRMDDSVLLVGSGAIALLFEAALRLNGVGDVTVAGRNENRLDALSDLGLNPIHVREIPGALEAKTSGRGFDVVVECAGKLDAWQQAMQSVRRGGQVVFFGGCPLGTQLDLDTGRMHYDDLTLISPFHFGTEAVRTAREWLLDERFAPVELITQEAELESAPEVFEDLRHGRAIKVAFMP